MTPRDRLLGLGRTRRPSGFRPFALTERLHRLPPMRRSLAQRFLAGLFGLWTIVTVSGVSLQACPEHGGGWLGGVASAGMDHHDATPAGGLMTDAMPAGHQDHTGGAPDAGHGSGHHGHQCTCPGTCCMTGPVSVPAGRLVAIPVVPVAIA